MKKLFLLSSISVFIGLMFLVFCTSQLYAAPPFPESDQPPFPGGLPAILDELAACQGYPGDGYPNPDAFGVSGHGPVLSYTEPVPADGTFTDDNTGLMWEIKDDNGGIHDKDNTYTWSSTGTAADGTLFSAEGFLDTLNNTCDGAGVACATDTDCRGGGVCGFAGYTDWRIPNIKELQSIVNYSVLIPSSSVPGETKSSPYWSVTTRAFNTSNAWVVNFLFGIVDIKFKDDLFTVARAVRP